MTDISKASPRPWRWDFGDNGIDYSNKYCQITDVDGDLVIADVNDLFDKEIGRANAALIVEAVNSHDELVSALEKARRVLAMLTEPSAIRSTQVHQAWGQAVEAELAARTALASIQETGDA